MSNQYQRVPTTENDTLDYAQPTSPQDDPSDPSYRPLRASVRAEFNRPEPSWWKRALLLIALIFMGWTAIRLGSYGREIQPKVIYATRYSDEHKYRPAASPVITEHLKDGKIRLRGATVGGVGIREEDLPLTPEKKRAEEKKRVEAAKEAAREKLAAKKKEGKKVRSKRKRGKKAKTEI